MPPRHRDVVHLPIGARGLSCQAYELFMRGATVDLLADSHAAPGGTFIGGIHTAACGAAWQAAVLEFGGVHVRDDHVEVAPRLPASWERLDFGLAVRGNWLDVEAAHDRVVVRGAAENPTTVAVRLHDRALEVTIDTGLDRTLQPE